MRVVFVGASRLATVTARLLLERGDEVIIVEQDKGRIEELSSQLDCGFLHGDGAKPAILREADPASTDFLLCLTGDDRTNIIAALVGRSLGIERVVNRVEDPDFEHIGLELGLEETIVPTSHSARHLADMVSGWEIPQLSAFLREPVRFFAFVAGEEDQVPVADLGLPGRARVIYYFREGKLQIAEPDSLLALGDEVVVVTHRDELDKLMDRWCSG